MLVEKNKSTLIRVRGRDYLYFGGTNYLGLSHRPELLQAATEAFADFGFSSAASRVTSGANVQLLSLEEELSAFAESDAALTVPAGFMSNTAVVQGIDPQVNFWVLDNKAHGSIKTAVQASGKPAVYYDAQSISANASFREQFSLPEDCTLGVFMEGLDALSGRLIDIPALIRKGLDRDFFIIDEAHSFGVLGDGGLGAVEEFNLAPGNRLIRTGTFSKAVGTSGGFILGSEETIDGIKNSSASYVSSTPLSPVMCAATRESLRLLREEPDTTINRLSANISLMNRALSNAGLDQFSIHRAPIYLLSGLPWIAELAAALSDSGICIPSMGSYFSDAGLMLRWTIQAGHTPEQLGALAGKIGDFIR